MKYLTALSLLLALYLPSNAAAQTIRRLLLFAGDSTNTDLKTQREWLTADSAGVVARHIWIAVFTDPKTFRRMYEYHDVDRSEFSLVLMGEGGVELFRSEKPVNTRELFELIDHPNLKPAEHPVVKKGGAPH